MRKSLNQASKVIRFPNVSYPRRALVPVPGKLTCLALIKHGETAKAVFVSDCGDKSKAAWVPKSMLLIIDPASSDKFIVATLPKVVADHKRLSPCGILSDPELWSPLQIEQLNAAKSLAARKRNQLRLYREPLPFPGRNAFA